ncbi:MAG: hypothetical protein CME65_01240 [Halobacteriovoraceae bacterium]|nr:hypothetical protein [Halobacteriovoraceae bacterium]|tara:strand:+ start:3696 stop:5066 length:1371 start_codon:yes stop_codon:yes gene_type:complete
MASAPSPFPWHYFVRSIRARIVLILLSSLLTFTVCIAFEENKFTKVLIIMVSLSVIAILQGFFRIIPFRKTLAKIDEIQVQLPHNKKLNIIYQKNEWILIQEMLKLTEKYIREQNEYITAQELQSHLILESIADPVLIVDSYLNCKQYNSLFRNKFVGDKEIKIFNDEKLWKIFDDKILLDVFEQAKTQKDVIRLNGHAIGHKYYDITVTPIIDEKEGIKFKLLGIFHDVTDSKLTEKMRVDFVANVSHEIRTPLTSIKGFAQLLLAQKDNCPPALIPALERINYNTERLKDLFDNLLKLSVIESRYSLDVVELDFKSMVQSIKASLQAKYHGRKIEVDIQNASAIYGDKKLLEQVFTNLMDNSIKYNKNQSTYLRLNSENNTITLQDNGPGISENDLKRIFERFYRVQNISSQQVEGTGLGLSIVKHIINKHNGMIEVESKIGEGTTFKIHLPQS